MLSEWKNKASRVNGESALRAIQRIERDRIQTEANRVGRVMSPDVAPGGHAQQGFDESVIVEDQHVDWYQERSRQYSLMWATICTTLAVGPMVEKSKHFGDAEKSLFLLVGIMTLVNTEYNACWAKVDNRLQQIFDYFKEANFPKDYTQAKVNHDLAIVRGVLHNVQPSILERTFSRNAACLRRISFLASFSAMIQPDQHDDAAQPLGSRLKK